MRAQQGAALVIGLILLLVLTILAVSGMNSASLQFIMAGSEQYRQFAFQASETGIQQALVKGSFNPVTATNETVSGDVNGSSTQAYSTVIARQLDGDSTAAPSGSSLSKFVAYHWEIQSTGTSARSATALHLQGVYRKALADESLGQDSTSTTSTLE
ncbi:MAG: PilX N-terminal domain-containing pilus assembly protein [Steroidobacteraceae bacterium]